MPRSWPYISQSLKLKKKITIRADFSLWKIKIKALLAHQSLEEALEEEDSNRATSSLSYNKGRQIINKVHSRTKPP